MQLGNIEHGTAGSPAQYGKSTAANVGYFAPGKWVGYVASVPYTVLTGPHPLLLPRESRILVDDDITRGPRARIKKFAYKAGVRDYLKVNKKKRCVIQQISAYDIQRVGYWQVLEYAVFQPRLPTALFASPFPPLFGLSETHA